MARINGNTLARDVTLAEGKKVSLPIGQVKEVIRRTRLAIRAHRDDEILAWVHRR